jgi:hypothetical protein
LSDATHNQDTAEPAAVHKPLEQWIVDVLAADTGGATHIAASHDRLATALAALGFERLDPEKASRLSVLLKSHKEHPLSSDETDELQTLIATANALELASLQRLAAALGR